MARILLIPLDERPCNTKFPAMIAKSGGIQLIQPNDRLLGNKKQPADTTALKDFLIDQASSTDVAILSLDMLVYGGLIPSRLHHLSQNEALARLETVRELKKANPTLTVYASMSIMRSPAYNSDDEEPSYYAIHGRDLFRRAYLTDKKRRKGLSAIEQKELDSIVIAENVVQDYENRKHINLTVNAACLDLLSDGSIDFLALPQDDSSPYGYSAIAQQQLQKAISAAGVHDQLMVYPGSDEVACTLLSRAICSIQKKKPTFGIHYASTLGPTLVPLYEDRPMFESLKSHVMACGGRLADSDEHADIELMVNAPGKCMQEARQAILNRDMTYDSFRNLPQFEASIERYLLEGRRVAVCDSAYSNGGDPQLVDDLDRSGALGGLIGYAGWNTNCNTLGTVLSQAVIADSQNPQTSANLVYRLIEDTFYQTKTRWTIAGRAKEHGGSYEDIMPCNDWAETETKSDLQKQYNKTKLSKTLPACIRTVRFPWKRLFEINLDVDMAV
ncbi:DUF4127 family protein [Bifidobacterium sp. ESL0732]|uniref:DUF4127 family protein n=1 Tax=Bifidobacterium sp. ESL0732 TaxID=2983222 RepID=UPI0023F83270|nr:DUF4127 family protein [Bifidobacterium sp. ESL0732]WEV63576.1 DUF4127 family protein [Bifidobacterium sp. ESL0732]